MKLFFYKTVAAALIFCGLPAIAGTPVLGFEIGVSTFDQTRATLSKQTKVRAGDTNKWTGGPMFSTDGSSYDIEGLEQVLYIFDDQKKLTGLVMTMSKDKFDDVFKAVAKKYKATQAQRPFVGNQFARFKTPDSVIEIDAPHLSFQMEVRYLRNDLLARFNEQSAAEEQAKKKKEASKF